jgi:uncharacterized membrane protein
MDIAEQQQDSENRGATRTERSPYVNPKVMAFWINGSAILLPAAAQVTIFFYCMSLSTNVVQTFAPSAMAAGAALISGSFIGFLFAVPRAQPELSEGSTRERRTRRSLLINTNLEQISDWLTKTIVGVALVEFSNILPALNRIVVALAAVFGSGPEASVMAAAILIFFPLMGFFAGYVATRTMITFMFEEFSRTDRSA